MTLGYQRVESQTRTISSFGLPTIERVQNAKNFLVAGGQGMKLDIFVFLLNLGLMPWLSVQFREVVRGVAAGDPTANFVLFSMFAALLFLAPIGATLKRWHAHQAISGRANDPTDGCLFNPVVYLSVVLVILATVLAFIFQQMYGEQSEPPEGVFLGSLCGGIVLAIIHTWLVVRYFSRPDGPPKWSFLRNPLSGKFGDIALWLNMIIFQLFWNLLVGFGLPRVHSFGELIARTGLVFFMALLIYFPPRMFTLLESRTGSAWTILLANLPAALRLIVGVPG